VWCLGELGPRAAASADRLRQLTRAEGPWRDWIRVEAARALWRVTGDTSAAVPVLAQVLSPVADGPVRPVQAAALTCLASMGSPVPEAVPAAAAILASPRRLGFSAGWRGFIEDEQVRAMAAVLARGDEAGQAGAAQSGLP